MVFLEVLILVQKVIGETKKAFLTGNEAIAWGCLAAEADMMFGYPITHKMK
jgi:2-oxoglutarate ferredoxin oxidoreductase subunit alpha